MFGTKFDKVWNTLSSHNFETGENISDDILCTICKKIMIDAHTATCGCHFCGKCIKLFLGNGGKHCPGNKDECSEEQLLMDTNVLKDLGLRRKIANLILKCPNELCVVKLKLEDMDEHVRICINRCIPCPYENIGCSFHRDHKDVVFDHLHSDSILHSDLIVEVIDNLRNDVDSLKRTVELKDDEIKYLREDGKLVKTSMDEMTDKIERLQNTMTQMENDELKREYDFIIEKSQWKDRENEMERELIIIQNKLLNLEEQEKGHNNELKKIGSAMSETVQMMERKILTMSNNVLNAVHDFVWIIPNFTDKINGMYDSDSFYKDNYKLCIRAEINNYTKNIHLGFYAVIMNGDKDSIAQWPMRHTLTLSIINQASLKTLNFWRQNYNSYREKTSFNRPTNNMNLGIYFGSVLVNDDRGILTNDTIIVCLDVTMV